MESSEVPESVATFDEHLHSFPMESSTAKDPDSEDEVVADTPKTGDKGKATAAEPIKEDCAKAFTGKGKTDAKAQHEMIAVTVGTKGIFL